MTIDELDTAKSFCEDGISHEVKGSFDKFQLLKGGHD